MSDENSDTRLFALMVLLAIWVVVIGYSLTFWFIEPEGDGFTRGFSRASGFLGWQGIAGMLAFALWAVGRPFPKGSGIRKISAVPLGMTLAVILLLLGYLAYSATMT